MSDKIKDLAEAIARGVKPEKVILFGSRAAGTAGPDSDLDLCVIKDELKDSSEEYVRIRKLLGRPIWPMDLLIFSRKDYDKRKDIWGTVQYEIDKNGIVVYERGN